MVSAFIFFRALGVVTLAIVLAGFLGYWLLVFFSKYRYSIKYKVLRRKHNTEDVAMLMQYVENNVSDHEFHKTMVLSNQVSPARVNELLYIFKEMKQKGGNKNE